jgi:hypothetical protein
VIFSFIKKGIHNYELKAGSAGKYESKKAGEILSGLKKGALQKVIAFISPLNLSRI